MRKNGDIFAASESDLYVVIFILYAFVDVFEKVYFVGPRDFKNVECLHSSTVIPSSRLETMFSSYGSKL